MVAIWHLLPLVGSRPLLFSKQSLPPPPPSFPLQNRITCAYFLHHNFPFCFGISPFSIIIDIMSPFFLSLFLFQFLPRYFHFKESQEDVNLDLDVDIPESTSPHRSNRGRTTIIIPIYPHSRAKSLHREVSSPL